MKISIFGGGTIGGSLAIRLKDRGHQVQVKDPSNEISERLIKRGIGKFDGKPSGDLTIICTPMDVEKRILDSCNFDGTILDVASVMEPFFNQASSKGLRWISGHPMAGNEYSGFLGWNPELFKSKSFFLSRTRGANEEDKNKVLEVVEDLGSTPIWIDPSEHDRIMSRVSHTTYFLSLLARSIGKDFEKFSGPGYSSTTRLSKQNLEMVMDMFKYNCENILEDLERASTILENYISILKIEGYEGIEKLLENDVIN